MKRYLIAIDSDGKCYVRETLVENFIDYETTPSGKRGRPKSE